MTHQDATPEEDAAIVVTGCTCDFSRGTRGMDRCARCDGTGSRFLVAGQYFPNTEKGYQNALKELRRQEP